MLKHLKRNLEEVKAEIKKEVLLLSSIRSEKIRAVQLIQESKCLVNQKAKEVEELTSQKLFLSKEVQELECRIMELENSFTEASEKLLVDKAILEAELDALKTERHNFYDNTEENRRLERRNIELNNINSIALISIERTRKINDKLKAENEELKALNNEITEANNIGKLEISHAKRKLDDRERNLTNWSILLNDYAKWLGKTPMHKVSKG